MADEVKGVEGEQKGNEDEAALKQELEAEGELYDESGKPLPWNHPKRVRRVYKEAKDARKISGVLKEFGLKASDLPAIIAEYNDFKEQVEEYREKQAAGEDTTRAEDKEAAAANEQAEKFKAILKKLGFIHKDDKDAEDKETRGQDHAARVINAARDRLIDIVEESGYDLEKMESGPRGRLLRHIDYLVSEEINDDPEALEAFKAGSLRPIDKYTKKVLKEHFGKAAVASPKASGIKNLPPRMSGSSPGSPEKKVDNTPPKNVKDATDQMVAELRARRLNKSEE